VEAGGVSEVGDVETGVVEAGDGVAVVAPHWQPTNKTNVRTKANKTPIRLLFCNITSTSSGLILDEFLM
jgi:hypothetical protein